MLAKRKDLFNALNAEAKNNGAFLISVAGAKEVIIETLPGSAWPAALAKRGFDLEEIQGGERILPVAVSEKMTRNADGTLSPLTEGSTHAVTTPGIVWTRRWSFHIP